MMNQNIVIESFVKIENNQVFKDGKLLYTGSGDYGNFIREIYKSLNINYSAFFKMDNLSKLGFCASEILLKECKTDLYKTEEVGIVFSNKSSSLDSDFAYHETIKDRTNYFPSPAVFVYTLPNIVIGEISIRHKFKGENMFFLSENFDADLIDSYVRLLFHTGKVKACLGGWVEYFENKYKAFLYFATEAKNKDANTMLTANLQSPEVLKNLYNN